MPPAARITDLHVCPKVESPPPRPHVGGPITSSASTVNIGYLKAARVTDSALCVVGANDTIVAGSPTVFIEGLMAARIGDKCQHGGSIVTGFPTVNIGVSGQAQTLLAAAAIGAPFCEECSAGEISGATEGP